LSAIILLISVSIFVAACFLLAFIWSAKDGQYEDIYTPSVRILFEDDKETSKENLKLKQKPGKN